MIPTDMGIIVAHFYEWWVTLFISITQLNGCSNIQKIGSGQKLKEEPGAAMQES